MLENSPDQLGEQVQIHELTRRKTNEGLLGSLAAGIASQVGKQTISKALGGTDVLGKFGGNTSKTDRAGAYQMGVDMARTLVPVMQKSWQQSVQEFLSQAKDKTGNPATSLTQVTTPSLDSLKVQLDRLISQSINPQASFNYTQLPQYAGTDPVAKGSAIEVVRDLETISSEIYNATVQGEDTSDIWQKLVTNGIAPAQNVMAYDKSSGGDIDLRVKRGSMPITFEINLGNGTYVDFDRTNPKHLEVAKMLGAA